MKLMKLFFRVILFTLFPLTLISQPLVIQWQQCYGGSDDDIGFSVLPSYNGFFLFGISSSTDGQVSGNHGEVDLWLVSIDSSGNFLKSTCFGGSEFDPAKQMKACPDGGYILLGEPFSTDGTVTNNHGGCDYWLIKTDREGDLQWQKCFGGSCNDVGYDLAVTSDSGFLCTGLSCSHNDGDVTGNHGVYDYWVIRVDKNGNLEWENSFGGTSMDNGLGLSETTDGGMILSGGTGSFDGDVQCEHHSEIDAWVVKLDSLGDIEWERCYGGSNTETIRRILPQEDGSYILLGTTDSDDGDVSGNHGGFDFWVLKIDHEGNIIWQKCFGGSYDDDPIFFKRLSDGNFIAGGLTMSNDGDVSGNHSFEGYRDMWIFKFTPQGDLLWQQCFGGKMDEILYDALELPGNRLLLIGYTYSNNTGDVQCTYRGFSDMWLLMVEDSTLTGVKESMESYNELKVFPNPASGSVTFSCGSKSRSGEIAIQITDQLGRMVKELILPSTGSEITWHTGTAYPGVYIYFYTIDNIKRTGKIVIMQSM